MLVNTVKHKLNISVEYRLRGQSFTDDIEIHSVSQQSTDNNNSVILGHFIVPHIKRSSLTGTEGESHKIIELLENNLSQMVSEPTRHNNILDFVIVTQDSLVNNIAVGEHFGSSDHKSMSIGITSQTKRD